MSTGGTNWHQEARSHPADSSPLGARMEKGLCEVGILYWAPVCLGLEISQSKSYSYQKIMTNIAFKPYVLNHGVSRHLACLKPQGYGLMVILADLMLG